MMLMRYLRSHRADDDTPYAIGGAVGGLALLIITLFALAAGDAYLLRSGSLAAVVSATLVELANGDRSASALPPLAVSPVLTAVAKAKAEDMAAKGYFAHVSPDGHTPWYWFAEEGYTFTYAGENLAVDFSDSAVVEDAWMHSPEHRANILNGRFTEVGIATAEGLYEGQPTTFVVEEFGAPAPASAPLAESSVPAAPTEPALATSSPVAAVAGAAASATGTEPAPATSTVIAASAPADPPALAASVPPAAPWWAGLAASPRTVLGYAYYALAVATLLLLAFVTEVEYHRRHLRHVAAAGSLLVLMLALFLCANFVFFAHPVLAAP